MISRSGRQRDGARGLDDAPHIFAGDFTRPRGDRCDTLAVETPDVRAGESDKDLLDFALRHGFGFRDALLDRLDSGFEIDDGAPLQSLGFRNAETDGFKSGCCDSAAISVQTFVEPMSRPTMIFSLRPISPSRSSGIILLHLQDDLVLETQIHLNGLRIVSLNLCLQLQVLSPPVLKSLAAQIHDQRIAQRKRRKLHRHR